MVTKASSIGVKKLFKNSDFGTSGSLDTTM
jgi:hypothetical protein